MKNIAYVVSLCMLLLTLSVSGESNIQHKSNDHLTYKSVHCSLMNNDQCSGAVESVAEVSCCLTSTISFFHSETCSLLAVAIMTQAKDYFEYTHQPLAGSKKIHYRPPIV
ncbi:hypothetical protein [Psychromonas marina]|uniref:hypothetical protein n=1 Tax=Psychromonas marina TaxID=88364 RepID=UPI0024E179C6|nr:hypothetical protein [Psychromonas marina]